LKQGEGDEMRMLLKYLFLTMAVGGLLMAQHGGGHHGGGGFASAPRSSGNSSFNSGRTTPPSFGAQPRSYGYGGGYAGGNRGTYSYSTGVNRTLGRRYGSERRYGRYGLAYYPVFGYGDSWYDPSYYPPYDQYAPTQEYPQYGLTPDPGVETMGSGYYRQAPYYSAPPVANNDPPAPAAPIVVVLKNGQRVQMQSYGIMNGLLWDFSRPSSQRIAMANIDVAASVKATEAVGGSFPEEFFAASRN